MLTLNHAIIDRIMNFDCKRQIRVIHYILPHLASKVIHDYLCIAITELHEHAKGWGFSQARLDDLLQFALDNSEE